MEYIKEHRPVLYADFVLNCKLHSYLADVDAPANAKPALLTKQIVEKEGICAQLKAQNQMAWVRAMNSIRSRAEEIVLQELIYEEGTV